MQVPPISQASQFPSKDQAVERFNSLKSALKQQAAEPAHSESFTRTEDRFELTKDINIAFDGKNVTVKKGSAFDDDILTRDKISTEIHYDSFNMEKDDYEHFSEKKGWWIFKKDQEMLKVGHGARIQEDASTHSGYGSMTFEI